MMQRAFVIGGFVLAGCGPQAGPGPTSPRAEANSVNSVGKSSDAADAAEGNQSAASQASASDVEPASDVKTTRDAKPNGDAKPTSDANPAGDARGRNPKVGVENQATSSAKPAGPSIHEVCFAMCDKLKPKCPKSSFEACQLNCGKYESPAEGCEDVVRAALTCARDAADLVCANVAPESCAKSFRRISACAAGQNTVEAAPTVTLPTGFSVYEDAREGISAPMPQGVAPGDGDVIAKVTTTEGTVYSIRKLPRPAGKINEKVFLKIGMTLFGRCSDKMKMQGMVDKPGRTSINYTTKCPDGSEEAGLFWATSQALFIASAKGQAGKLGPTDAFLYGFDAK